MRGGGGSDNYHVSPGDLYGGDDGSGGNGGGFVGEDGYINGKKASNTGGTQTKGYSFGAGESTTLRSDTGGGGGGWYGGKCTNNSNGGAGGGSGYIYGHPDCVESPFPKMEIYLRFIEGQSLQGIHNGNGYAAITFLKYTDLRKNSNYYQNVRTQSVFDFNILF